MAPITMYPGVGQVGPVQTPKNPLDALAAFLQAGGMQEGDAEAFGAEGADILGGDRAAIPAPSAMSSPGVKRNQGLSMALGKKYGADADGSISQADLEAMDSFIRGNDVADKSAIATAPITAKGGFDLAQEGMRNRSALDVERQRGENAARTTTIANEGKIIPAQIKADDAPNNQLDPQSLQYWVRQAQIDRGVLSQIPAAQRSQVLNALAAGGVDSHSLTNQSKQMAETAHDLLKIIQQAGGESGILGMAKELEGQGLFNPVVGPIRKFAASHGAGSLMGVDDATAAKIGEFNNITDLLRSGLARAHAGARGAGNSGMAERFDKLLGGIGDFPTFAGQLQGIEELLRTYSGNLYPDEAPGGGMDPYADENYQPR